MIVNRYGRYVSIIILYDTWEHLENLKLLVVIKSTFVHSFLTATTVPTSTVTRFTSIAVTTPSKILL